MNKKQKKVLIRIIVSIVLLTIIAIITSEGIGISVLSDNRIMQLVLYLIPYFVIGYDISEKIEKEED